MYVISSSMRGHLCSYFVLFTEIKYLRLSEALLGNQNVSRINKRAPELILKRDFFCVANYSNRSKKACSCVRLSNISLRSKNPTKIIR